MKDLFKFAVATLIVFTSIHSLAFNPPTDSHSGVTFEIMDVDKVEKPTPLLFKVKLSNGSSSNINGEVRVWLNDDWSVEGANSQELSVPAGDSRTLEYSATAGPHVLSALYPVHAEFKTSDESLTLHPIAIFEAKREREQKSVEFTTVKLKPGILRLDGTSPRKVFVEHKGETRSLGINFKGSDPQSRASFDTGSVTRNNKARQTIIIHPPYKDGSGVIWADYKLAVPEGNPAKLSFHTAIRDSHPGEGSGSDGVEFKVFVADASGKTEELFSRFSAAKVWESGGVDLSAYAGQEITLRLWSGPGPHNNTSCDNGYWGDPAIVCGEISSGLATPAQWSTREITATATAKKALTSGARPSRGCFLLRVRSETFGVGVIPGKQGLTDAVIAFTDGTETLLYRGFEIDIDRTPIGAVEMGSPVVEMKYSSLLGNLYMTHYVSTQDGIIKARATISSDGGALRIAWDMPGARRDERGTPRYTRLGIGSCCTPLKRAYAGFGNVVEEPESFVMHANGFCVSTRHIGADYENGISLLQASTIFPDRALYNKESGRFALETPHDTDFLFVPSAKGAFAAARAYRNVCGFKRSPGWNNTAGKMCLDQWGGDYKRAAEDLAKAGKYGLNDSIFVKHVWQHWGYDYRLPEIYPPRGSNEDFMAMRQAAGDAGIIFAPHDNYIDFYPDAEDYSYDHIIFNEDGTPQKAWYNEGREALSYRWLPHAFQPWMKDNMRLMRKGFKPDGLFIDVFTAMAPRDYYDRDGNFYTRERTAKLWGDAFDTCRWMLKWGSPMISEAGTDALIGSIDAGQADHRHAVRYMGKSKFKAGVRTPWHDMASHGSMVLLAGGLGHRYGDMDGSKKAHPLHSYASDDYLSNTVIGGRNPMCDGPFSRRTVMTYWLLHDICAELACEDFESHEFGETIMQQHTTFGKYGKVWSNRGDLPWTLANTRTLPKYGFYAENGSTRAGIITLDGQRAAFAQSKDAVFVDARPLFDTGAAARLSAEVTEGRYLGQNKFSFTVKWDVTDPGIPNCKPFLHFDPVDDKLDIGDNIAFQCGLNFPVEKLQQKGAFEATTTFAVPKGTKPGDYAIRFGLYNPNRIKIAGNFTGSRVRGGIISVKGEDSSWRAEDADNMDKLFERNIKGKVLDFGSIKTDGAFRVVFDTPKKWTIIPLPGSRSFTATLDLKKLGAKSDTIKSFEVIEPLDADDTKVEWEQKDETLIISPNGRAFGYAIDFD